MRHFALPRFWQHYQALPKEIQQLADKNFALLQADPMHASLHFKRVGRTKQLWSMRAGIHYRALAVEKPEGMFSSGSAVMPNTTTSYHPSSFEKSWRLQMNWEEQIEINPKVLVGKPVIRRTRLAVEFVVELLANGWSEPQIIENYAGITHEDISACLH